MSCEINSKMYRYENRQVSVDIDGYGENFTSRPEIRLCEFVIIKKTPKGKWIETYEGKKFILDNSRKRFACETKELAKASFIARKNRQRRILVHQLENIESAIKLIQELNHGIK